jgi:hypothetical protein
VALEHAFGEKLALAAGHDLGAYVVTQFCFAPVSQPSTSGALASVI